MFGKHLVYGRMDGRTDGQTIYPLFLEGGGGGGITIRR